MIRTLGALALAAGLTGCAAVAVVDTAVGVTTTVVETTVDVTSAAVGGAVDLVVGDDEEASGSD